MRGWVSGVLAVAVVASACGGSRPDDDSGDPWRDVYEWAFIDRLNKDREALGLSKLRVQPGLREISREWSVHVADLGRNQHRPDMRDQVNARITKQWTLWGENVGYGESVDTLHAAFMASPSHRANAVGEFDYVGAGVELRPDAVWVTFSFLQSQDALDSLERPAVIVMPNPAPSQCGRLRAGEGLSRGGSARSCDGRFSFTLSAVGDVVVTAEGGELWSAGTAGRGGFALNMEPNGSLTLLGRDGSEVWSTGTFGEHGAELLVQDDGNVVLYRSDGRALWKTGTCCR